MKNVQINLFNSIFAWSSTQRITLEELAQRIKSQDDRIDALRSIPKDHPSYRNKKLSLPSVLLNGTTHGGANHDDIVSATGLIYVDVDSVDPSQVEEVKAGLIESFPSLLMCWRSVSGQGVGGVLRADNILLEDFPHLKRHFASLRIAGRKLDLSIFTIERKTIISSDPDLYCNWEAPSLDLSDMDRTSPEEESSIKSQERSSPSPLCLRLNGTICSPLRFDNVSDYFTGEHASSSFRHFPKGISIVAVDRSIRKIEEGGRNAFVYRNLLRIVHLNPGLNADEIKRFAYQLNTRCLPPMGTDEVNQILGSVISSPKIPIPNKRRKLLNNPALKLSSKERRSQAQSALMIAKGEATRQRIYDAIEAFDPTCRIDLSSIAKFSGVPLSTVKKHGKHFREIIQSHNKSASAAPYRAEAIADVPIYQLQPHMDNNEIKRIRLPFPPLESTKGWRMVELWEVIERVEQQLEERKREAKERGETGEWKRQIFRRAA